MNRIIITSVVISKGFDNKPALHFNEGRTFVRFKVGEKFYDKQAQGNTRWVNHSVKAFGSLAERIDKMGLKEGSYVNLSGRLDEDVWDDKGTTKRMPVIILEDVEYCYSGKKQENAGGTAASVSTAGAESEGFGGFEPYGEENPLY